MNPYLELIMKGVGAAVAGAAALTATQKIQSTQSSQSENGLASEAIQGAIEGAAAFAIGFGLKYGVGFINNLMPNYPTAAVIVPLFAAATAFSLAMDVINDTNKGRQIQADHRVTTGKLFPTLRFATLAACAAGGALSAGTFAVSR